MFASIRNAIIAIFSAVSTLAGSANKFAQALDVTADVTLDEAEHYREKRRAERATQLEQI